MSDTYITVSGAVMGIVYQGKRYGPGDEVPEAAAEDRQFAGKLIRRTRESSSGTYEQRTERPSPEPFTVVEETEDDE